MHPGTTQVDIFDSSKNLPRNNYYVTDTVHFVQEVSAVTVVEMHELSPTVKGFTMHAESSSLSFKPGQWYVHTSPDNE